MAEKSESEKLLESAILINLEMTPEERIEAHENARQLMMDLQEAGRVLRATPHQTLAELGSVCHTKVFATD